MNKLKLFLLTMLVVACEPAFAQECSESGTLTWEPANTRTDGSLFSLAETGYYEIMCSAEGGAVTLTTVGKNLTSHTALNPIDGCGTGEVVCSIATVDTNDNVSKFSAEKSGYFAGGYRVIISPAAIIDNFDFASIIVSDAVQLEPCSVVIKYGNCRKD